MALYHAFSYRAMAYNFGLYYERGYPFHSQLDLATTGLQHSLAKPKPQDPTMIKPKQEGLTMIQPKQEDPGLP